MVLSGYITITHKKRTFYDGILYIFVNKILLLVIMRLKIKKVIRQIKVHEFQKTLDYPIFDPGYRRAAHAPMCVR
jgi:hypothetical protein